MSFILYVSLTLVLFSAFFTVHGFECEDSFQQTGTRKISTCPFGDQFCVTYESRYLVHEQGADGNATGNVVWNVTEEYRGCESILNGNNTKFDSNGSASNICSFIGEGCWDDIDNSTESYMTICCCRGNMCNERSTTTSEPVTATTDTTSKESTTTTDDLRCEGFFQNTGTRLISTCPGDDFCYTLENKYVQYEIGPDGNATNDIAWNITLEYRGCESMLQEVLYIEPNICKSNGDEEGCYEGVYENPIAEDPVSDLEWKVCCCKGDLCNKRSSTEATTITTVSPTSTEATTITTLSPTSSEATTITTVSPTSTEAAKPKTTTVSPTSAETTTTTSSSNKSVKIMSFFLTLSTYIVSSSFY